MLPQEATSPDLQLQFAPAPDARTYISHQFSRYPFHICRAQYMDANPAGMATVYLQSSAGGIFANDRLSTCLHALQGANAHVTTQASTVVHRMDDGDACQTIDIRVEDGGYLEYLPDPMILFPNAKLRSCVSVRKHPSASVIMSDSFLAHDPAAGAEVFSVLINEVRIEDLDENLLCLDRNVFYGDAFIDGRAGIMGPNSVLATFLVLNSSLQCEQACAALRDSLQAHADVYVGISTLPNQCGVWARLLSPEAVASREALNELWRTARRLLVGSYPGIRRK
jgi:urease accessory protein